MPELKEILGLPLTRGIKSANPVVSVDGYAGPYESVEQANASVPQVLRKVGREVYVYVDEDIAQKYWWQGGTGDEHLVPVTTQSGGGIFIALSTPDIPVGSEWYNAVTGRRYLHLKEDTFVEQLTAHTTGGAYILGNGEPGDSFVPDPSGQPDGLVPTTEDGQYSLKQPTGGVPDEIIALTGGNPNKIITYDNFLGRDTNVAADGQPIQGGGTYESDGWTLTNNGVGEVSGSSSAFLGIPVPDKNINLIAEIACTGNDGNSRQGVELFYQDVDNRLFAELNTNSGLLIRLVVNGNVESSEFLSNINSLRFFNIRWEFRCYVIDNDNLHIILFVNGQQRASKVITFTDIVNILPNRCALRARNSSSTGFVVLKSDRVD